MIGCRMIVLPYGLGLYALTKQSMIGMVFRKRKNSARVIQKLSTIQAIVFCRDPLQQKTVLPIRGFVQAVKSGIRVSLKNHVCLACLINFENYRDSLGRETRRKDILAVG